MFRRALLAAVAAASVALPAVPRAQEWAGQAGDGYDVSVDLNVQGGVGVDSFHGPLAPYGDWVAVGSYGQVWRPRVAPGWRPYFYGRWEWTNEGWFWVSEEPWGWATYHYGRWAYDPYYGWIWVPGSEWAPAWVSWRYSGDVVGWAPLAPGYSVYANAFPFVDSWWTFVPCDRFVSVPVRSVAYAPHDARRWYGATAPAPAFAPRPGMVARGPVSPAWGGPAPRVIEQRLGRPLSPARMVRAPSPGERGRPGEIQVYRPPARDERRAPAAPPGREYRQAPGPAPGRGGFAPGGGRAAAPAPAPVPGGGRQGWTPPRSGPPGGSFAPPAGSGRGGSFTPPQGGGRQAPPAPAPAPAQGGGGRGGGNAGHGGERGGGHGRPERH